MTQCLIEQSDSKFEGCIPLTHIEKSTITSSPQHKQRDKNTKPFLKPIPKVNITRVNTILREVKSHRISSADLCHLPKK